MKATSQQCIRRLLGAAMIAIASLHAATGCAQSFPTKPVRLLVALGPGSGTDIIARTVAGRLSELWGQPVIVENKAGGAGAVAGTVLVSAPPDGHTLMAYSDGHAVNAALNHALPYDSLRDIARVCQLASFSTVLVARPSLGASSVKELARISSSTAEGLSYASSGVGGGLHLSAELLNASAGIKATHIPFKGVMEGLSEIMAGRVDYMFSPLATALPLIRSGKLVALATGAASRIPELPDTPTVGESGAAGFEYELWAGLFAPAGTPHAVLEQISADVARVMALPDVRDRLVKLGFSYKPNTPDDFERQVRADVERISALARKTGLTIQ